jgi:hypothetical protein
MVKNNEIKLNVSIDAFQIEEALKAFRALGVPRCTHPELLRLLEQERESQRWATDPLELGYIRNGARRVRFAVASAFWGVARFCDRCSEILEG